MIRPRRRVIDTGGGLHVERLARAFVAIVLHKRVEAGLLLQDVRRRRMSPQLAHSIPESDIWIVERK